MKLRRRALLHLALASAAVALVSSLARAETYPTRPVRVIVGFAPGGSADITGRLIGQWLSERLHQQFLIENRPGAGTNIATASVIEAPPDGYTLLFVTAANSSMQRCTKNCLSILCTTSRRLRSSAGNQA
jgi:tripartite-type tricarboxylate transporter receptor subunit TctC